MTCSRSLHGSRAVLPFLWRFLHFTRDGYQRNTNRSPLHERACPASWPSPLDPAAAQALRQLLIIVLIALVALLAIARAWGWLLFRGGEVTEDVGVFADAPP